eukprot:2092089-Rhodomonas_salina.1
MLVRHGNELTYRVGSACRPSARYTTNTIHAPYVRAPSPEELSQALYPSNQASRLILVNGM